MRDIPEHSSPILKYIHSRIWKENLNFSAIISGPSGSGKSYVALRIAEIFDKEFDVKENVVYTTEDYLKRVAYYGKQHAEGKKDEVRGRVLIVDEAGLVGDSTSWYNKTVKSMKYTLQTYRYLGLITLWCIPNPNQFLKAGHELMNAHFRVKGKSLHKRVMINGIKRRGVNFVVPYLYEPSPFMTNAYRKFKRRHQGVTVKCDMWYVTKPARKLWQPYERLSQKTKSLILAKLNAEEMDGQTGDIMGRIIFKLHSEGKTKIDIEEITGQKRLYINEKIRKMKKAVLSEQQVKKVMKKDDIY